MLIYSTTSLLFKFCTIYSKYFIHFTQDESDQSQNQIEISEEFHHQVNKINKRNIELLKF